MMRLAMGERMRMGALVVALSAATTSASGCVTPGHLVRVDSHRVSSQTRFHGARPHATVEQVGTTLRLTRRRDICRVSDEVTYQDVDVRRRRGLSLSGKIATGVSIVAGVGLMAAGAGLRANGNDAPIEDPDCVPTPTMACDAINGANLMLVSGAAFAAGGLGSYLFVLPTEDVPHEVARTEDENARDRPCEQPNWTEATVRVDDVALGVVGEGDTLEIDTRDADVVRALFATGARLMIDAEPIADVDLSAVRRALISLGSECDVDTFEEAPCTVAQVISRTNAVAAEGMAQRYAAANEEDERREAAVRRVLRDQEPVVLASEPYFTWEAEGETVQIGSAVRSVRGERVHCALLLDGEVVAEMEGVGGGASVEVGAACPGRLEVRDGDAYVEVGVRRGDVALLGRRDGRWQVLARGERGEPPRLGVPRALGVHYRWSAGHSDAARLRQTLALCETEPLHAWARLDALHVPADERSECRAAVAGALRELCGHTPALYETMASLELSDREIGECGQRYVAWRLPHPSLAEDPDAVVALGRVPGLSNEMRARVREATEAARALRDARALVQECVGASQSADARRVLRRMPDVAAAEVQGERARCEARAEALEAEEARVAEQQRRAERLRRLRRDIVGCWQGRPGYGQTFFPNGRYVIVGPRDTFIGEWLIDDRGMLYIEVGGALLEYELITLNRRLLEYSSTFDSRLHTGRRTTAGVCARVR